MDTHYLATSSYLGIDLTNFDAPWIAMAVSMPGVIKFNKLPASSNHRSIYIYMYIYMYIYIYPPCSKLTVRPWHESGLEDQFPSKNDYFQGLCSIIYQRVYPINIPFLSH